MNSCLQRRCDMGGKNDFIRKRDERDRKFFDAGMQVGIQMAADYITL